MSSSRAAQPLERFPSAVRITAGADRGCLSAVRAIVLWDRRAARIVRTAGAESGDTWSALGGPAPDCCRTPIQKGNRMSHIGNFVSHIKSDLTGPGPAGTVDFP